MGKVPSWIHHYTGALRGAGIVMDYGRRADGLPVHEGNVPDWSAPVFVLQDPFDVYATPELWEEAMALARARLLALPFDIFAIEVRGPVVDPEHGIDGEDHSIILVGSSRVGTTRGPDMAPIVFLSVVQTDPSRPQEWVGGFGAAVCDLEEAAATGVLNVRADIARTTVDMDASNAILGEVVRLVFGFLALLGTPVVERERVEAPAKLNKARAAKGKAPLRAHEVVTLRLPKVRSEPGGREAGEGGRSRARPSPHWRRGHLREYKPGKFTRIPITVVACEDGKAPPQAPRFDVKTRS